MDDYNCLFCYFVQYFLLWVYQIFLNNLKKIDRGKKLFGRENRRIAKQTESLKIC